MLRRYRPLPGYFSFVVHDVPRHQLENQPAVQASQNIYYILRGSFAAAFYPFYQKCLTTFEYDDLLRVPPHMPWQNLPAPGTVLPIPGKKKGQYKVPGHPDNKKDRKQSWHNRTLIEQHRGKEQVSVVDSGSPAGRIIDPTHLQYILKQLLQILLFLRQQLVPRDSIAGFGREAGFVATSHHLCRRRQAVIEARSQLRR